VDRRAAVTGNVTVGGPRRSDRDGVGRRWVTASAARISARRRDSNPNAQHSLEPLDVDTQNPLFFAGFDDEGDLRSGVKRGSRRTRTCQANPRGPINAELYGGAEGIRTPDPLDANDVGPCSIMPLGVAQCC
jgi:hypothetical protein